MKSITYRHSYSAGQSREEEMAEKFGILLFDEDTSEIYEQESSHLFYDKTTDLYTWIDANGCSCWDGDYDGWELTKDELLKLANTTMERKADWRERAEDLVAEWIIKNIK